jgi:hypothetical protein
MKKEKKEKVLVTLDIPKSTPWRGTNNYYFHACIEFIYFSSTELTWQERCEKVFWIVAKTFSLLFLLYIFICSLDLLSSSLQLLGGRATG